MTHRALPLLLLLTACASTLEFDVGQDVPEQTVQGSALPGILATLFPLPLSIDIASQVAAKKTGPIHAILLTDLHLDITDTQKPAGDTDDWSFVKHVDLYVQSTKKDSSLPKVKVATVDQPGAVQRMSFAPLGVNLLDYVNEGAQLTSEVSGTQPADDTSFVGHATFRVQPL